MEGKGQGRGNVRAGGAFQQMKIYDYTTKTGFIRLSRPSNTEVINGSSVN